MVRLSAEGKATLDRLVAQATADPRFPSFVFGAATADEEIYFNGGGYRVKDDPMSGDVGPETVFRLYSQTKTITSIAALHLIENGGLSESDPVSKYLPEFSNAVVLLDPESEKSEYVPAKTTMTVKHLLNFTSGLNTLTALNNPTRLSHQYLAEQDEKDPIGGFVKLLKVNEVQISKFHVWLTSTSQGDYPAIPLVHEPGEDFSYGWSADILGFVIERASGKSLETYMKENIFQPLSMTASFYLRDDLKKRLVTIVGKDEASGELRFIREDGLYNIDPTKVFAHLGGLGLYASARDYLKLLRHLLEIFHGTAKDPILSKATLISAFEGALAEKGMGSLAEMYRLDPFAPSDVGFWQWSKICSINTKDLPGRRRKGSGSWGGWANTFHFVDPNTSVTGVFQTNMVPTLHRDVLEYYAEFEKVLYIGLE